jgi:hypothetical protein
VVGNKQSARRERMKSELDLFGEMLMTEVRDRAINQWFGTIEGRMKSPRSREIFERFHHLKFEEEAYLKQLFTEVVDTALHFLLSFADEDKIDIILHTESCNEVNIKSISDGLAGELYSDDGWISRFSKFNGNEKDV